MSGSMSGMWKRGTVWIMRHRQTKGPDTDRPDLNNRATSRLYSLFESATPQWVFECFGRTGVFKPREAVGLVNTRRVLGSTFQYPSRQLRAGRPKFWHNR